MTSRRRPRGFTLIELLTVIAIIGILAAILIPTVGRVRQSARASQSASNLRQVHTAIILYTSDNRNALPKGQDDGSGFNQWPNQLRPYISAALRATLFANPNAPVFPSTAAPFNTYSAHPLLNTSAGSGVTSLRLGDIANPSRFVLLGDGVQGANTQSSLQFRAEWVNRFGPLPAGRQATDPLDDDTGANTTSQRIGYYNGNRAHVVMLDGSLRSIGVGELTYGHFAWRR